MKLYYSNTSPYSRKVRLVIAEKGLGDQVEGILINPFNHDNADFSAANPLGKIPVLVLDNGKAVFDSPVICHYLDGLSDTSQLIPQETIQKVDVLCWEALADGLIDATYNIVMERKRVKEEQSASALSNWSDEILRTLESVETRFSELKGDVTLAHLALASAIGYLDFRLSEILYVSACPQVTVCPNTLEWYEAFKTRPAMQATQPYDE